MVRQNTYTNVLCSSNMPSIFILLGKDQLRWSGHVIQMGDNGLSKHNIIFYSELSTRKCTVDTQVKEYKDPLKATLKNFDFE